MPKPKPAPVVRTLSAQVDSLILLWDRALGAMLPTVPAQLRILIHEFTEVELERAIRLVAVMRLKPLKSDTLSRRNTRAFYAVLREWRAAKVK